MASRAPVYVTSIDANGPERGTPFHDGLALNSAHLKNESRFHEALSCAAASAITPGVCGFLLDPQKHDPTEIVSVSRQIREDRKDLEIVRVQVNPCQFMLPGGLVLTLGEQIDEKVAVNSETSTSIWLQVYREGSFYLRRENDEPVTSSRYVASITADDPTPAELVGRFRIAVSGQPQPTVVHLAACKSVSNERDLLKTAAEEQEKCCKNALANLDASKDPATRLAQLLIDTAVDSRVLAATIKDRMCTAFDCYRMLQLYFTRMEARWELAGFDNGQISCDTWQERTTVDNPIGFLQEAVRIVKQHSGVIEKEFALQSKRPFEGLEFGEAPPSEICDGDSKWKYIGSVGDRWTTNYILTKGSTCVFWGLVNTPGETIKHNSHNQPELINLKLEFVDPSGNHFPLNDVKSFVEEADAGHNERVWVKSKEFVVNCKSASGKLALKFGAMQESDDVGKVLREIHFYRKELSHESK